MDDMTSLISSSVIPDEYSFSTVETMRLVFLLHLGMAMGSYLPFLSLGTSMAMGPREV